MCGVFFLAVFWLINIISRFSFFLQAFLTWRLLAPFSVPQQLCYCFLTPAVAHLSKVRSGEEEPGEGHMWTVLGRATAKARDHPKYLPWQPTEHGARQMASCSKCFWRIRASCWLLWERRCSGVGG